MIDLEKINSIYFIGIGGSGMSSIANMMLIKKKSVAGSEKEATVVTRELEKRGASIAYQQTGENITPDLDLIVYTVAIPGDNLELQRAKEMNTPLVSYPEMLGLVSKNMTTIAVAGTHGKTTTTAMLATILGNTDINPSVIIGASFMDAKPNFIEGSGEYLLVEADEYKKSFLNLGPKYLIITNVDEDHLDFYKDLHDIQSTFAELVAILPEDGCLVCNTKDPHLAPILVNARCKIVDYVDALPQEIKLLVPGLHNRQNASAAFKMASVLGIDSSHIVRELEMLKGVRRRFEYRGKTKQRSLVFDDYAHNPQKVFAALQGAKETFPNKRIIVVFQPHLFSRTKYFLKELGRSFTNADVVLLTPIYGAREMLDPSISSEMLSDEIEHNNVTALSFPSVETLEKYLDEILKEEDIVIFIGAGDIVKLSEKLVVSIN